MFPNPRQFVGLQIVLLSGGRPEFAAAARRIGKRPYREAPPNSFRSRRSGTCKQWLPASGWRIQPNFVYRRRDSVSGVL